MSFFKKIIHRRVFRKKKSGFTKKPRFYVILAVVFVLLIGIIGFVLVKTGKVSFLGIDSKSIKEQRDSDNDGLSDWDEELYKTDPHNPDTDGDGTPDGEEIKLGRNPLVRAPGDKLFFYPLPYGDKYNITNQVLNEEMLDSILNSYILQKGEYILDHPEIDSPDDFAVFTDQETVKEMSKRAIAQAYSEMIDKANEAVKAIPEIFNFEITDKDILVTEDNSKEAVEKYLARVSLILNSDNFFLQERAYSALKASLEEKDFSKLDQLIKENDIKIETAKTIVVPSSWKEIHKEGLRLTLLIRNIYASFRDLQNDPLKAYLALEELEKFPNSWNELMKEAVNLAQEQGIELEIR